MEIKVGEGREAMSILKKLEKKQKRADKAWQKACDSRPLHRKGSWNRQLRFLNI
jgi:hypothetical protein